MEVSVSPTYLISIIATSTVLASLLGAALGLFGQVWLEKLKHKHKKEDRKEDGAKMELEDLIKTIADILEAIERINKLIDNTTTGLRGLYYDKIQYLSNRYIAEKQVTFKEIADLDKLYEIYKACLLGEKNGTLKTMVDKVHKLEHVNSKPDHQTKVLETMREIMGGKKSTEPPAEQEAT